MRLAVCFIVIAIAAANVYVPAHAQDADDDLRVYAVRVINTSPFKPFSGYGVYLGHGMVITAAHVVGRWALFENPRIRIAGEELPASVIKKGSFEQTDLALLSVDEASLPFRLRLRRDPLCKALPNPGTNVVVVYPERTVRSQIFSPRYVAPIFRTKCNTLLSEVQGSVQAREHARALILCPHLRRRSLVKLPMKLIDRPPGEIMGAPTRKTPP